MLYAVKRACEVLENRKLKGLQLNPEGYGGDSLRIDSLKLAQTPFQARHEFNHHSQR